MKRLSHFFIDQPVVAIVVSLLIVLAGSFAVFSLPITEYPDITPPRVTVQTVLPGATAEVLEKTVAVPIEERINGAKDMLYMSSRLSNDGTYILDAIFNPGTNADLDAVEVQNRLLSAESSLPPYVVQNGLEVQKHTPALLAIVSLFDTSQTYDTLFLSNWARNHLQGPLTRIEGVGTYEIHGPTYAMRLWLQPDKMGALGVTADDVKDALSAQNSQTPPGQLGMAPSRPGSRNEYTITANTELATPEEFENLVVKTSPSGAAIHLRDIGRAELGAQATGTFNDVSGDPGTTLQLYEAPGGNALNAVKAIRSTLAGLSSTVPKGVTATVTLDTSLYIQQSIQEVLKTFGSALVLVLIIVFLFLGSFRATIIPMTAVPVSLIGAVGVFGLLGFSINLLSLFGLVLAIGLVVDDAIIVVEAVERHIEEGASPKDAAKRAMDEVSRAILAIATVLSFVFIPVAFIPGVSGSFYREFALTLAAAIIISAFAAVSLTPALCSLILRPGRTRRRSFMNRIVDGFARAFGRLNKAYDRLLLRLAGRWRLAGLVMAGVVAAIVGLVLAIPAGFVPDEDQGYFYVTLTLPDGTSIERTQALSRLAEARLKTLPGVSYINTLGGYTFLEDSDQANASTFVVDLKPWSQRRGHGLDADSLSDRAVSLLQDLPDAEITPQAPSSVPGLGGAGGFTVELQDRGGGDIASFVDVALKFSRAAAASKELDGVYDTVRMQTPQLDLAVDRDKAAALNVPVESAFDSLQIDLGGLVVNNFNRFGRIYKTIIQSDGAYRSDPEDLNRIMVRAGSGADGKMLPLKNILKVTESIGPNILQHYNMYRSIEVSGNNAAHYSSGQALAKLQSLAAKLPPGYGFDFSDLAFQQERSKGKSGPVFALALVFVYLILAAQFSSWLTPLPVLLAVPTGAIGVYGALFLGGLENNIYAQIGVLTMIGLSAKNAVLIVEFADQALADGNAAHDAALKAASLRFRPILMTSMAFILGVLPLLFASGAEAVSRRTLGATILGGMISTTILSIFITPIAWIAVQDLRKTLKARGSRPGRTAAAAPEP